MSRDFRSHDRQDAREAAPRTTQRRHQPEVSNGSLGRGPGDVSRDDRVESGARERRVLKPEREDSPRAYYLRDRTYLLLRESELHTLTETGRFRVVAPHDL